jgi:hypothetical protein
MPLLLGYRQRHAERHDCLGAGFAHEAGALCKWEYRRAIDDATLGKWDDAISPKCVAIGIKLEERADVCIYIANSS